MRAHDVDVQALDVDFLTFTGHKVYGPSGIGVLYGRKELLEKMPPFLGGGAMIESVSKEVITYGPPPERFEAGTPPIVEAVGLAAALDYMMLLGRDEIAAHEASLSAYAHDQLDRLNWLTIYGRAPGKGGIISFTMDGLHPHDISMVVDRSGVAIRAGHHCAQPLDGTVWGAGDVPGIVSGSTIRVRTSMFSSKRSKKRMICLRERLTMMDDKLTERDMLDLDGTAKPLPPTSEWQLPPRRRRMRRRTASESA